MKLVVSVLAVSSVNGTRSHLALFCLLFSIPHLYHDTSFTVTYWQVRNHSTALDEVAYLVPRGHYLLYSLLCSNGLFQGLYQLPNFPDCAGKTILIVFWELFLSPSCKRSYLLILCVSAPTPRHITACDDSASNLPSSLNQGKLLALQSFSTWHWLISTTNFRQDAPSLPCCTCC